eukprot:662996-Prymnesium_polylepis.1
MGAAEKLIYTDLVWGDEEAAALAKALTYAHVRGAIAKLTNLDLESNKIGDEGMKSFSTAL